MKRSNRLILLIGVFLAALAFVFIVMLLNGGGPDGTAQASAPPTKLATVVAARDIPLGVAVTSDMLTTKTLDVDVRLTDVYGDPTQVVGQVTRANVKKDQQVTAALFQESNASQVDCPAGFTCIGVEVDQVSGVGTLIKSGDYVDLVAGVSTGDQRFPIENTDNQNCLDAPIPRVGDACYDHTSVKMLLQGVQVVGTLLPAPPTTETGATASAAPGTALNGQQEIVIVAVTTQQAEVVKFAQLDGSISLSLRSPLDFVDASGNPVVPPTTPTTGLVLKTMIDNYGVLVPTVLTGVVPAK